MAGVLDRLIGPQKKHELPQKNPMADETAQLQSAKEILAEVFGIDVSDVDEMIRNRFAEAKSRDDAHETELWPVEFSLGR
jgi:hypothetical protein